LATTDDPYIDSKNHATGKKISFFRGSCNTEEHINYVSVESFIDGMIADYSYDGLEAVEWEDTGKLYHKYTHR
jgi:hypothetical protein